MPELETFIQNKDIREMRKCSAPTAVKIMKKIRDTYRLDETKLPRSNVIPLSLYNDFFRVKSPREWAKKKDL